MQINDLLEIITQVTAVKIDPSDYDVRFKDLGIDSLDHMTILLKLEECYSVKIPDEDVDLCRSVDETMEYVSNL